MFEKILDAWKELTFYRLVLGVFAGFMFIVLYVVFEQRQAVFVTITGSVFTMVALAAGFILLAMAGLAGTFVAVSERRTDRLLQEMQARVKDWEANAQDQQTENKRLHQVINATLADERRSCDLRIDAVRRDCELKIDNMAQMMRRNGMGVQA